MTPLDPHIVTAIFCVTGALLVTFVGLVLGLDRGKRR